MAVDIQGLSVSFWVREAADSDGDFRRLVCSLDDQAEIDNEVTETDTKCGTFTGVKEAKGTYSGNAAANADPNAGTEVTYGEVLAWQAAKTLLDFELKNDAFDSIPAGDAGGPIYHSGQGRFTNSVLSANVGEVVQFSWTFSPSGALSFEPQS